MEVHQGRSEQDQFQGDGTLSDDWSDEEFAEDSDEGIYDCPEQDESRFAERPDNGDGYNEGDDIYDTPEDAREVLKIKDGSVPDAMEQRGPPIVSRLDKPNVKQAQRGAVEGNRQLMDKQRRAAPNPVSFANTNAISSASADQSDVSFETYDVPKSPLKKMNQEPPSRGFPKPTPSPKPAVAPKTERKVSGNANSGQIGFKTNVNSSVRARWPPKPQREESPPPETYDAPPPNENPHQNIINKLSKVINTNTPNVPVRDQRDITKNPTQVNKSMRADKPFPKPDNRGDRAQFGINNKPSQHVSKKDPVSFPRNGGNELAHPCHDNEVPNVSNNGQRPQWVSQKRQVPLPEPQWPPGRPSTQGGGQHAEARDFSAPDKPERKSSAPLMPVDQENYEVPSTGEQENYEVPHPGPQRPPGRPLTRGGGQRAEDRNFSAPDKPEQRPSAPLMPVDQENYEVPTHEGQENYEVPQPGPQRPPGRPSMRGGGQHTGDAACPASGKPEGRPSATLMQVDQENYEVPSTGEQENYEVPQPEPQRPAGRPSMRGGGQNAGDMCFQGVPGRPGGKPLLNEGIGFARPARFEQGGGRSSIAPNYPGNTTATGNDMIDADENYEVPRGEHGIPSREPMKLPGRPPVVERDSPSFNDARNQGRNNPAQLTERNTSELARNKQGSLWGSQKRNAPPVPVEPENYEVPSTEGHGNYEVPAQEPGRPRREPFQTKKDTINPMISNERGRRELPQPVSEVPSLESRNRPAGRRHDAPLQPPNIPERSNAPQPRPIKEKPAMPEPSSNQPFSSEITMDENYEVVDQLPVAVPPRGGRPNTLGLGGPPNSFTQPNPKDPPKCARSAIPAIQEPVEQKIEECVDTEQDNYECVDQPTKAAVKPSAVTPNAVTPNSAVPQFGALMQELNRKNSVKGNPVSGRGNRSPPEGQENTKAPQQSPMDQILTNVISGLERPVAVRKPPRVSKPEPQPQAAPRPRPSSIRKVPPRPGSESCQDAPLLDLTELGLSEKSPSDVSPRLPGRPVFPLPSVPQQQTPDQILKKQPWFQGDMERKTAEDVLKKKGKNGGFIVRNTTKIDGYSISIYYQQNIRHLHILRKDNMFHLGTSQQKFDSVVELVKFFMNNEIELKAGGITKLFSVL